MEYNRFGGINLKVRNMLQFVSTHITPFPVRGSQYFFILGYNEVDINLHFYPIYGAAFGMVTFSKRNRFHVLTNENDIANRW